MKIIFLLLIEIFPKKDVILRLSFFLISYIISEIKLKRVGSKVKVIMKEVINPKVIIHPKSIIGLISLKIKDKKSTNSS